MVLPSFRPFVLLPVCPSFHLSRRFLGIVSLVFSKFWNGARNLYEVVRDRAELSGRIFLPPKLGKWTKNGPKTGSFKFIEKSGHYFLLNLSYNKNLFYLLHFWKNCHIWENFCSWDMGETFSANQIAGFFNQPYIQNRSLK